MRIGPVNSWPALSVAVTVAPGRATPGSGLVTVPPIEAPELGLGAGDVDLEQIDQAVRVAHRCRQ